MNATAGRCVSAAPLGAISFTNGWFSRARTFALPRRDGVSWSVLSSRPVGLRPELREFPVPLKQRLDVSGGQPNSLQEQ